MRASQAVEWPQRQGCLECTAGVSVGCGSPTPATGGTRTPPLLKRDIVVGGVFSVSSDEKYKQCLGI